MVRMRIGVATTALAALIGLLASPGTSHATPATSGSSGTTVTALPTNAITTENQAPGSTGWRIPWVGYTIASDTNRGIKAYASAVSVDRGGAVSIMTDSAFPGAASYSVYRLGWYQGLGGRKVWTHLRDPTRRPLTP